MKYVCRIDNSGKSTPVFEIDYSKYLLTNVNLKMFLCLLYISENQESQPKRPLYVSALPDIKNITYRQI